MKCVRCEEDKEPKYPPPLHAEFVCAMCCYDAVYGVK